MFNIRCSNVRQHDALCVCFEACQSREFVGLLGLCVSGHTTTYASPAVASFLGFPSWALFRPAQRRTRVYMCVCMYVCMYTYIYIYVHNLYIHLLHTYFGSAWETMQRGAPWSCSGGCWLKQASPTAAIVKGEYSRKRGMKGHVDVQ